MNALILVLPVILLRYGLLSLISSEALHRAGHFPPVEGKEKITFWVYQLTTILMFIFLFFLEVKLNSLTNYIGLVVYIVGLILYTISFFNYAKPIENGLNMNGLYQFSRNPMYVAFFLSFLGCSLLTNSWLFLILLIIFQISVHFLIKSGNTYAIMLLLSLLGHFHQSHCFYI